MKNKINNMKIKISLIIFIILIFISSISMAVAPKVDSKYNASNTGNQYVNAVSEFDFEYLAEGENDLDNGITFFKPEMPEDIAGKRVKVNTYERYSTIDRPYGFCFGHGSTDKKNTGYYLVTTVIDIAPDKVTSYVARSNKGSDGRWYRKTELQKNDKYFNEFNVIAEYLNNHYKPNLTTLPTVKGFFIKNLAKLKEMHLMGSFIFEGGTSDINEWNTYYNGKKDYVEKLNNNVIVLDQDNKIKATKTTNNNYKIGPFKLKAKEKLGSIEIMYGNEKVDKIYDESEKEIKDTKEYFEENKTKKFYINTKLTDAQAKGEMKLTVNAQGESKSFSSARLIFFKNLSNVSAAQHLLVAKGESKPNSDTEERTFTPSVDSLTGNIVIFKTDQDHHDYKLSGAKFKIKNDEGNYIKATVENGEYTYNKKGSVIEFQTNSSGKITIKNVPIGDYVVEETEAPDNYALSETSEKDIEVKDSERFNEKELNAIAYAIKSTIVKDKYVSGSNVNNEVKKLYKSITGYNIGTNRLELLKTESKEKGKGYNIYKVVDKIFEINTIDEFRGIKRNVLIKYVTDNRNSYSRLKNYLLEVYNEYKGIDININYAEIKTMTNRVLGNSVKIFYNKINTEKTTGNIVIIKTKLGDHTIQLSGANFKIKNDDGIYIKATGENGEYTYDKNGSVSEFQTNSSGKITIKNVPIGKYTIEETKAPEGYEIYTKSKSINVKASNRLKGNEGIKEAVKKMIEDGNAGDLSDLVKLYNAINIDSYVSSIPGIDDVKENIQPDDDTYNLEEVVEYIYDRITFKSVYTQNGYLTNVFNRYYNNKTSDEWYAEMQSMIEIAEGNSVKIFLNKKGNTGEEGKGQIIILKSDLDDYTKRLNNATFKVKSKETDEYIKISYKDDGVYIYNESGNLDNGITEDSYDLKTNESGRIKIEGVPVGDYEIEEVSAPNGYEVYTKVKDISVKDRKRFWNDKTDTRGYLKDALKSIMGYNYVDINNNVEDKKIVQLLYDYIVNNKINDLSKDTNGNYIYDLTQTDYNKFEACNGELKEIIKKMIDERVEKNIEEEKSVMFKIGNSSSVKLVYQTKNENDNLEFQDYVNIISSVTGSQQQNYIKQCFTYIYNIVYKTDYNYKEAEFPIEVQGAFERMCGRSVRIFLDSKKKGKIEIMKKDQDTEETLSGVGFKIAKLVKNENNELIPYYRVEEKSRVTYANAEGAGTELKTDENGRILIDDLDTDCEYLILETTSNGKYINNPEGYDDENTRNLLEGFGKNVIACIVNLKNAKNSNYTVTLDDENIVQCSKSTDGEYNEDEGTKVVVEINNKKKSKKIKLSGKAWVNEVDGKDSSATNIKFNATKDVEVFLVDKSLSKVQDPTGEYRWVTKNDIIGSEKIMEGGKFEFKDVDASKLADYTILFRYNGMFYRAEEGSDSIINSRDTSKVTENNIDVYSIDGKKWDSRASFNGKFYKIDNNSSSILYDTKTPHVSNFSVSNNTNTNICQKDINSDNYYISPSGIRDDMIVGAETMYTIAYYDDKENQKILGVPINNDSQPVQKDGSLKINYEDILNDDSITEISEIDIGFYRREQPDLCLYEDIDNVQVSLDGKTHKFNYNNFNNNVNIQNIKNEEDPFVDGTVFYSKYVKGYIREVYTSDVIYDAFESNKMNIYVTYNIKLLNESTNLYNKVNAIKLCYANNYELCEINGNKNQEKEDSSNGPKKFKEINLEGVNIAPQKSTTITVKYKLNNDAIKDVLNGDMTLNTFSEITSYETYSDKEFLEEYGGIDKDSQPGNAMESINNAGISLNYKDVFVNYKTAWNSMEDDTDWAPPFTLKTTQRIIKGTVWEDLKDEGRKDELIGNGKLDDSENKVQDVKVELLDKYGSKAKLYKLVEKENKEFVKSKIDAEVYTDKEGNYKFDGVIPGDYIIRFTYSNEDGEHITKIVEKNIDPNDYKSTIYRGGLNDENLDNYWYITDSERFSDAMDNDIIIGKRIENRNPENRYNYSTSTNVTTNRKSIYAKTHEFTIDLVYDSEATTDENGIKVSKFNGNRIINEFNNIDFGIIKRPAPDVIIKKTITDIKLTLANGQTIISGNPQNDTIKYLTKMPEPDGKVKIELDNELIHGSKIEVEYTITAEYGSDNHTYYLDRDYYIYGKIPENAVAIANNKNITITRLFDYVSPEYKYDKNDTINGVGQNSDFWKIYNIKGEDKERILSKGAYEKLTPTNNDKKYTILQTDQLGIGEENAVKLKLSKVLSSKDEIDLTNDVEINEYQGAKLLNSIPGNYVPGTKHLQDEPDEISNAANENDCDEADVSVTTPTGIKINAFEVIALSVSALAILFTGIILIKKKVLK